MLLQGFCIFVILDIQIKYGLPYCAILWAPRDHPNAGAGDTPFDKAYLICIIAQVLKIVMAFALCSYWHFVSDGGSEYPLKAKTCDQVQDTQPITTTTTSKFVFTDIQQKMDWKPEFNNTFFFRGDGGVCDLHPQSRKIRN